MFKKLLVAVLLTVPLCCKAQTREWTDNEKLLGGVSTVLMTADWLSTRNIAKNPNSFSETNPLLGTHPTIGEVNTHFLIGLPLFFLIMDHIESQRTAGLLLFVGYEAATVTKNYSLGLRFSY
jgi:hypothetical protein